MFFRTFFSSQIMSKSKGNVFYAVGIGHKTGVYDSWSDCKKQVEGVANPKFKKFDTLKAAQDFVSQWQSKSSNVHTSPISPKQGSGSQHSRLSDTKQRDHHSLQQKGDTNLKIENKKKKKKKCDQNFNNRGAKRIYYMWDENRKGPIKNSRDSRFFYERNKKNGITSNKRKEKVKNNIDSYSSTHKHFKKWNADVTIIQDPNYSTNQQGVQAYQTVVPSNWNSSNSVRNSPAALSMYQTQQDSCDTNYSSYQQYSTTGRMDVSANHIQRTCTSDYNVRYIDIVNTGILDVASIPLPGERHSASPVLVNGRSMQDLANNTLDNVSNSANAQTTADDSAEENLSVISIPCTKIETRDETIQEIEISNESDVANESGLESVSIGNFVTNEGDETNTTCCGDTSVGNTETNKEQHIKEVLKTEILRLINEFKNETALSIVTDILGKIVDIVRVTFTEITSKSAGLVGGDRHQLKVNDFSKIKVPQSRECRKSNSFSGDLEPVVANNAPQNIDMEEPEEGGDAIDLGHLRDNLRLCERKLDMLFCKFSEFLSSFTDVRNELVQVRKMLPRSVVLRNEMDSRAFKGKALRTDFSRSFVMNCDSGERDDAFKIQKDDSQGLRTVRTDSTSSGGDMSSRPTPAKRKRAWDDFSSSSAGPALDEEIKEERDDYVPFTTDEDDYVVVFTDGSCVNNGSSSAKAGIGIWFDDGHPLNVSRPLTGVEPTNNNAEIQAARIACELALSAGITKLKICTDSEFLINCITKWIHRWKSNGWMTGASKPVRNRVELEKLYEVVSRLSVRWEKVEGHANIKGNEMADRLSKDGADGYFK